VTTEQPTKKKKSNKQNNNNNTGGGGVTSGLVIEPYVRKVSIGRVIKLYLSENGLEGTLSEECGLEQLNELKKLSLYGNFLGGQISPVLCKLVNLNYMDLEENYFVSVPFGTSLECKTVNNIE
jgi:hypothetical protein